MTTPTIPPAGYVIVLLDAGADPLQTVSGGPSQTQQGQVLAVVPGTEDVAVGDTVVFSDGYGVTPTTFNGQEALLVPVASIAAVGS